MFYVSYYNNHVPFFCSFTYLGSYCLLCYIAILPVYLQGSNIRIIHESLSQLHYFSLYDFIIDYHNILATSTRLPFHTVSVGILLEFFLSFIYLFIFLTCPFKKFSFCDLYHVLHIHDLFFFLNLHLGHLIWLNKWVNK